jgi:hypothetical protein
MKSFRIFSRSSALLSKNSLLILDKDGNEDINAIKQAPH